MKCWKTKGEILFNWARRERMAKGLPQCPGAGVSEKQGRLGETYGSNHVDNRPDGGRTDLFCQQRLHLLHFFVSRAVHRRRSPQGRHPIRVRFPSVATSGPGASLFHHTRILHPTTATTMQTNAKSAQQSAVKIYNAVYSSVQVCSP